MFEIAQLLQGNTYPGRGIIIGKTPDGTKAVTAYFIMGRSENSRNRVFCEEGTNVMIYPFDASKVEDPSLIIYAPVRVFENRLIVTNGDQTDTIYNALQQGGTFESALSTRTFEPDAPNFTPRISGMLSFADNDFSYRMSILKCLDPNTQSCARFYFAYPSVSGIGHFIHTYAGDGNPIPTFAGEPEPIGMADDIDAFTHLIWDNLNEANKISLYVRYVDLKTGGCENRLINKNI